MGFVQLSLMDDAEFGRYKIWVRLRKKWDLGEQGAEINLFAFIRKLKGYKPGLLDFIAGAKVSTDAQGVLVVYLDDTISAYKEDKRVSVLATAMRAFSNDSEARVGFTVVSYSPTLTVLKTWVGEYEELQSYD